MISRVCCLEPTRSILNQAERGALKSRIEKKAAYLQELEDQGSPDLKAAREVAEYIGTFHHEFYFTVQEGIDALEEVIYHIETYELTTIRALIQEWWGVDFEVKNHAKKIANLGSGYRALIPDLYRGKVGLDVAEAQHLMDGLDWQGAVKDIDASVKWLKANGSSKA